MPHPIRFVPALIGLLILGLMLFGSGQPADNLCRLTRMPDWLGPRCRAAQDLPLLAAGIALALIALTLLLLLRWQRSRPRAISYESDAGRWVVLGWILAVAGGVSLLIGMLLIGSGGWPFSQQSRHVTIATGQLPISISTVQRRYFASYFGADGTQSLCAGFGEVTIRNRSRARSVALDLGLAITPRRAGDQAPQAAMPTREDLSAIVRRGLSPQSIFRNPVELAPRESLRRELVFVIRPQPGAAAPSDRDHVFRLEVQDRLSGRAIAFALPAEYRG